MQIRADFDSGNIQVIDASDPRRIRLAIRPDLASQHFQWFHFKVEGMAAATEHRFTLVNAGQSAYSHAWSGYQAVASYDGERWFRVPSQYDATACISSWNRKKAKSASPTSSPTAANGMPAWSNVRSASRASNGSPSAPACKAATSNCCGSGAIPTAT